MRCSELCLVGSRYCWLGSVQLSNMLIYSDMHLKFIRKLVVEFPLHCTVLQMARSGVGMDRTCLSVHTERGT